MKELSMCHCEEGAKRLTKQSPESWQKAARYILSGDCFVAAARLLAMTLLLCASHSFAQQENPFIPPAQKFFENMESGRYHEAWLLMDSSVRKMASEQQIAKGWLEV